MADWHPPTAIGFDGLTAPVDNHSSDCILRSGSSDYGRQLFSAALKNLAPTFGVTCHDMSGRLNALPWQVGGEELTKESA